MIIVRITNRVCSRRKQAVWPRNIPSWNNIHCSQYNEPKHDYLHLETEWQGQHWARADDQAVHCLHRSHRRPWNWSDCVPRRPIWHSWLGYFAQRAVSLSHWQNHVTRGSSCSGPSRPHAEYCREEEKQRLEHFWTQWIKLISTIYFSLWYSRQQRLHVSCLYTAYCISQYPVRASNTNR